MSRELRPYTLGGIVAATAAVFVGAPFRGVAQWAVYAAGGAVVCLFVLVTWPPEGGGPIWRQPRRSL